MFRNILKTPIRPKTCTRLYADACEGGSMKKGLVLGLYEGCNPGEYKLTPTAHKFDEESGGKLSALLKGSKLTTNKAQVFTNLSSEFYAVAVTNLGNEEAGFNSLEVMDECKENIRKAAGIGARALQDKGILNIMVEGFRNTEAAAEGAALAIWNYTEYRNPDSRSPTAKVDLFEDPDREGWQRGILKAEAQNVARRLEETPANLMTPSIFAQTAIELLCPCGVQVDVRDKDWLESKKMNAFITVSRGSCEQPLILELSYCAGPQDDRPVVVLGKGVTFDSGGICLKKCEGMPEHRADMAGAAVTVALFKAIASMNLPVNIIALVPLCENMPGGLAVKPGDVVLSLSGKSIRVEDTDNEGRILLSDILTHTAYYKPCLLVNIATLSDSCRKSLGESATPTFTTSEVVWREMERAGSETGDRVWRMPIWNYFTRGVTDYLGVDVNNVGKGGGGGLCLACAFLMEFVPPGTDFVHMDIKGTGMKTTGIGFPYLRKGTMSGRPTRTLVQFLYQMACPHDKGDEC